MNDPFLITAALGTGFAMGGLFVISLIRFWEADE
jgi:hypothetical protein